MVLNIFFVVVLDRFAQSGGGDGLLVMVLVLHDLPFMVTNIFGPNSQVTVDHGIYHGLSTDGDLLPPGRKVMHIFNLLSFIG